MNRALKASLTASLVSARAAIDAALHTLESDGEQVSTEVETDSPHNDCDHPPDERIDLRTFTDHEDVERWKCKLCGERYDEAGE